MQQSTRSAARRPLPAPLGLLPESWKLPRWLQTLLKSISGISGVEAVAANLDFDAGAGAFARQALQRLGVHYQLPTGELAQVPQSGGVIIVANHPFGGIDGLIADRRADFSSPRPEIARQRRVGAAAAAA